MNPTPREFFRKNHKADSDQLALTINEPWFQRAVVAAMAEMGGLSAETVKGAKFFVVVLHSLAEDDQTPVSSHPPDPVLETYRT